MSFATRALRLKRVKADGNKKALCPKCGKRVATKRRPGSLTSYLFGALDCACAMAENPAETVGSRAKGWRSQDSEFCPKCGLKIAVNSQTASLTAFLFQSTRCKCPPDQAFADGKMSDRFWKLKKTGSGSTFSTAGDEPDRTKSNSVDLLPGAIIGGVYEIISLLGRGGMGEVYLARHASLHKKCALKVIPPEQVTEIGWQRFQLEAKAVAKLNHINLVRVTDLGIHEGCLPFYAMDYVEGQNLAEFLAAHGPMPLKTVLEIFMQVSDGVECAHRSGIIHRDLKPANIMLLTPKTGATQAKVLDFGLAKLTRQDRTRQSLTAVGDVFGSPYYMSPEQCSGDRLDNRSDIYSLGCTIFECLTGRPPFDGHLAAAVIFGHLEADAPSLESVVGPGKYSAAVEVVVAKLLRKNPVERYQNLSELRGDLERVARGEAVQPFYISRGRHREDGAGAGLAKAALADPTARLPGAKLILGCALAAIVTLVVLAGFLSNNPQTVKRPQALNLDSHSAIPASSRHRLRLPSELPGSTEAAIVSPFSVKVEDGPHGTTRTFFFPPGENGARIALDSAPASTDCSGPCTFPVGAPLRLICVGSIKSDFIRSFRPDDLFSLSLKEMSEGPWTGDQLEAVSRLQGLNCLDLRGDEFLCKVVPFINKLVNLKSLIVTDSDVTGEDLLTLSTLPRLQVLQAGSMAGARAFLKGLARPMALKRLDLSDDGLTDDDMPSLARIVSLQAINLNHNAITCKGLEVLTKMPNLQLLGVLDAPLTPKCIETFSHFQHLRYLSASVFDWSNEDRLRLIHALPHHCMIEMRTPRVSY